MKTITIDETRYKQLLPSNILETDEELLSNTAKWVLAVLLNYQLMLSKAREKKSVVIDNTTLSKSVGKRKEVVLKAIEELIELELIKKVSGCSRKKEQIAKATEYFIQWNNLKKKIEKLPTFDDLFTNFFEPSGTPMGTANPNANANANPNANTNTNSNPNTNTNTNPNTHTNSNTNTHTNSNTHTNTDSNTHTNTDSNTFEVTEEEKVKETTTKTKIHTTTDTLTDETKMNRIKKQLENEYLIKFSSITNSKVKEIACDKMIKSLGELVLNETETLELTDFIISLFDDEVVDESELVISLSDSDR